MKRRNPRGIAYVQGDAQDLAAFGDCGYDGVVCHMALMDIPALAPTIASVARVLRDEGWFVFSIVHPCYRGHVEIVTDYLLDHRYRKRLPRDWLPAYAYHRPLGTYVDQLAQAGFCIERVVEMHHAHGAFEPAKMCSVGRIDGASTSDPSATCTYSPPRTTEKRSEPHVPQRVWFASGSPHTSKASEPSVTESFSRSIPANDLNAEPVAVD